jgi:hypothetical protein
MRQYVLVAPRASRVELRPIPHCRIASRDSLTCVHVANRNGWWKKCDHIRAKADAMIANGKPGEAIEPQVWLSLALLLFAVTVAGAEKIDTIQPRVHGK